MMFQRTAGQRAETLCDAAGTNCVGLPSDSGRQHYVKWNVPAADYRLRAVGTITEERSGKSFDVEPWSDNNHLAPGARVVETSRRTIKTSKGLGMSFVNDTQVPATWHAEATQHWNW
jgi:hypothetical protein